MMAQPVALARRQSSVMAMAEADERARVDAWSSVPSQFITAAPPALAGELFGAGPLSVRFILGCLLQVLSAISCYAFFRRRPPAEEVALIPTADVMDPG